MERFTIHSDAQLYFLTFSVTNWLPLFTREAPCLIITDSLNHCHQHKQLRINAFVIMPTHLHLILFDADFDSTRLSKTVTALRKHTGRQLAEYCDRHMQSFAALLRSSQRTDRARHVWQQSKHPVALTSRAMWQSKFDYVHDNPCRAGLVRGPAAWRFSSAAFWSEEPHGASDVVLSSVEW